MTDKPRAPRENWGQVFRRAVSSGKGWSIVGTAAVAVPLMVFMDGVPEYVGAVGSVFALVAAHPKSPLIPLLIHWLPRLPSKGSSE